MIEPEDISVQRSQDLDRRSFLRTTEIAAAATLTGGFSIPRLARAAGVTSPQPRCMGGASSAHWENRVSYRLPGVHRCLETQRAARRSGWISAPPVSLAALTW